MEIKEVEKLLSVSRSNIRFYEKQGLIRPERCANNYRDYSDADIAMLKKIIVLRKMGFSVEEIAAMQNGDLSLNDAVRENIIRLEAEIEQLSGALETAKELSEEQTSFEAFNEEHYWKEIAKAEENGQAFAEILHDYLRFELMSFDVMWKYVFFHDFKKSRQRRGVWKACGILLLLCVARGVGKVLFWKESFWSGFLYPFAVSLAASAIVLPLYILSKKAPRVAAVIAKMMLVLIVAFFAFLLLLILYGIIRGLLC